MMANNIEIIRKIEELLDQNFIFDVDFKLEIKSKISGLDAAKLARLLSALQEADDFERKALTDKIKEDKNFYGRVVAEKRKLDEKLIKIYQDKMRERDKNKIGALLARTRHL